jgi:hypothetical protein
MTANKITTTKTRASRLASAMDDARERIGTLDDRTREIVEAAFNAGYAAAKGAPMPFRFDPKDQGALLDTLEITKREGRPTGGNWISGTIGGHRFEALVFAEHAERPEYELEDSRISKLWLKDGATDAVVFEFDRGPGIEASTEVAKAIVGLLVAGLAETVFGN